MQSYRQVYENLYVGGHESSKRRGDEFDTVISMSAPSKNTDYKYIIDDGEHEYSRFESAVDKGIKELSDDKKLLVHCKAGLSRSVAVCVAIQVCYFDNIGYIEAIRNARSGFRLPENELMFSAEKYIIKNNCSQISNSSEIDAVEMLTELINDIESKKKDKLSKKEIKLLIGEKFKEYNCD